MTDAEPVHRDILIRVHPRRSAAAPLLSPLDHILDEGNNLLWIGSAPDCGLRIPGLSPHQIVVRRLAADSVAIQDQSGGGIRYQPPGQAHPTVSNTVTVSVGECVTVDRYNIEIRQPEIRQP